ncbi:MAG: cyclic nucleotide-binding domain-containing protein [bacterium]|nr:cyclic nucleotide-binding domain-containing protein [bacterium]
MPDAISSGKHVVDPEWENLFSPQSTVKTQSLERLLGRVSIFSLLRARELRTLARMVHVREFSRGEVVIHRGVQQSGLYLVRTGSVHIVREGPEGKQRTVATLGIGELLGEFALLDDTPRSTSVIAAEKSELVGFFKPDLTDILATKPSMGCMILLRLGEDMTQTLNRDYANLRELGWPQIERPEGDTIDPTTA